MDKWTDVITNPLGLAGFALFLVFTVLSRVGGKNRPVWLMPTFVGMAIISLAGGLWLASINQQGASGAARNDPAKTTPTSPSSVTQITTGNKSPAITGVTGNVTITETDTDDEEGAKP